MKFTRSDSHKKKKVGTKWKKPRGLHNKVRLEKKGYVKKVKIGYKKKPKQIMFIRNKEDLKAKPKQAIIAKVSRKNKEEIIEEAKKLGIIILNLNINKYKQKTIEKQKLKEDTRKAITQRKSKKKEKTEKKEEKEEKELTEDDKKKEEKKEKDKILTKKS